MLSFLLHPPRRVVRRYDFHVGTPWVLLPLSASGCFGLYLPGFLSRASAPHGLITLQGPACFRSAARPVPAPLPPCGCFSGRCAFGVMDFSGFPRPVAGAMLPCLPALLRLPCSHGFLLLRQWFLSPASLPARCFSHLRRFPPLESFDSPRGEVQFPSQHWAPFRALSHRADPSAGSRIFHLHIRPGPLMPFYLLGLSPLSGLPALRPSILYEVSVAFPAPRRIPGNPLL